MTPRCALPGRRLAAVLAPAFAALAVLALAPQARAQEGVPSQVRVELLRRVGGDRQVAWVSVLDANGVPVGGLSGSAFAAAHDGRPVEDLKVTPFREAFSSFRLTLLVDPAVLQSDAGSVSSLLSTLARGAAEGDRVTVRTLARAPRTIEVPLARAGDLGDRLAALGDGEPDPRIYDALYDAVRDAARAAPSQGRAVLAILRGHDQGSGHGPLDVLAAAGLGGRTVPIGALMLGDDTAEFEKLQRLVSRTGGDVRRLRTADAIPEEGVSLVRMARGAYRLEYRVPDFEGSRADHLLTVRVQGGAGPREGRFEYSAADVTGAPWWKQPLPWVMLGGVLLLAGLSLLFLWRRQLCRLVVARGEEQGCRYEIYGLPVTLGAAVGNDLTFPESRVSRNHAVLEKRGSGIELLDLNSENGTFVNGERVSRRQVVPGDRIGLGGTVELVFE